MCTPMYKHLNVYVQYLPVWQIPSPAISNSPQTLLKLVLEVSPVSALSVQKVVSAAAAATAAAAQFKCDGAPLGDGWHSRFPPRR